MLIEAQANVNMNLENAGNLNKIPESPLFYAKRNGHQKVMALLIQHGAIDKEALAKAGVKPVPLSQSAPLAPETETVPLSKDRLSLKEPSYGLSPPKNQKYRTSPSPRIKNPTPIREKILEEGEDESERTQITLSPVEQF